MEAAAKELTKALTKNTNNPILAWQIFKRMTSNPNFPSNSFNQSIPLLTKILINAKMFTQINTLHQLVLSNSPDFSGLLIRAIANSGHFNLAVSQLQAFRSLHPNKPLPVSLYNVLIRLSIQENDTGCVRMLYKDMVVCRVAPDTYTFNLLIGGLCDSGCLDDARKVFDKMSDRGCRVNEFTFGILVRGYCRAGRASESLELLEVMRSMEAVPNIVVYNTLVSAFCKEGKTDEAEKLVERMREDGLVPNVVTFNSRISGLCRSGKVLEASRIFRDMQVDKDLGLPQPDIITYNLMLEGFCKEGMMEEVKTLIECMKEIGVDLGVESYNIWLLGLLRNGLVLEAQAVLDEMTEKGLHPTIVSYNTLMDGLCKNGMLRDAKMVMSLMKSCGVVPDVVSYSILIHGYCKKGNISEANNILRNMIANGCFPNNYTCNSLLKSLWKEGKVVEAEELLNKMKEGGYALDMVTYNIVLDGLCKAGKVDRAIETMHELWNQESDAPGAVGDSYIGFDNDNNKNSCKPDLITYSTIINALCKDGKLDEAKKKLVEMIGRNIYPDSIIYDIFVYNLCKMGKVSSAFRVLKDMEKKGYNKSLQTYNSLILGLGMKSQFFEMYGLMDEMKERGISPNVFTYNNMIRCLCESGQIDDATKLLDEMLTNGVSPNISTFKLLIRPLCQIGEFRPAQDVFDIAVSIFGHKEVLYSFMFNELVAGEELLEAKDVFMSSLDRCFDIGNFIYQDFIGRLCKAEMIECASIVLRKMIKTGYSFEPASFMPVIDGLRLTGNNPEADEFAQWMLDMGSEPKVTNKINQNARVFTRRKPANNKENNWQSILHRDDGSGSAMKIVNKLQKGWGHARISNLQSPEYDLFDS
uniref:pentatricopeptide repeat-containing protein At2g17140 n=1 Tax=Erigeron canadensis TaxID=72917 RepID=UPI001CB92E7F|nr:pentatricopeptide repeat-containing protein At2g17140 [Erigeron canadensis]XP_043631796.1 pentatricopeptide repeat-containing protein At2g17140 [Erigeron canadensis]XP_043631804.1 pentatricopeptide repeat-containing protein At2g17140 [Erigeron canadensis]XP_043631813.1 pentatricopeptide repeat-containing protein At2g17140 [Erigeron canadensis]XP_043631822.1 pentatricopeptide repeat-containing protein At2g17140 [Erigeron canadensis]